MPPPGSQSSFSTPPKSTINYPEEWDSHLINKNSLQSCPPNFLLISTSSKISLILTSIINKYGICREHIKGTYKDWTIVIINLDQGVRISTMLGLAKRECTVTPVCVRGIKKPNFVKLVKCIVTHPDFDCEFNMSPGEKEEEKQLDHKLLNEFAIKHEIVDTLFLMSLYKKFAKPTVGCELCNKPPIKLKHIFKTHSKEHLEHFDNANIFEKQRDQKKICQFAVDNVLAEKRYRTLTLTREEIFENKLRCGILSLSELLKDEETADTIVTASLLLNLLLPEEEVLMDIFQTVVLNPPKRRYFVFKGPINTGKTTVAAALMSLLGGVSLNINGTPERLNFELGCAIDAFCVLLEDVKGTPSPNSNLQRGLGMINLDNMRDYLEGTVPVNLERKHQNKVSQVFPPGFITMNDYILPDTVRVRCKKIIDFKCNDIFAKGLKANYVVIEGRWLIRGEVLLMILLNLYPHFFKDSLKKDLNTEIALVIQAFDCRFIDYKDKIYKGKNIYDDE